MSRWPLTPWPWRPSGCVWAVSPEMGCGWAGNAVPALPARFLGPARGWSTALCITGPFSPAPELGGPSTRLKLQAWEGAGAADSAGPLAGSRAAVVLILTAAPQSGDGSPHSSGEAREVTQPERGRGRLGSRVSGVGCGHCMGLSLPGWKVSSGPLLPLGILVIPIL